MNTPDAPPPAAEPTALRDDLMYLAGRLPHRSAQTAQEQAAADYIETRFREHTPDVSREAFPAIDNPTYLFASYFSEFLVIALIAAWWPAIAFFYGLFVFLAYLVEFNGYRVFERFLPHFGSQNITARFLGPRPDKLLIVTAYYDSAARSPLSHPATMRLRRPAHTAVLFAMAVVLATCAIDAAAQRLGGVYPGAALVRYGATAFILTFAVFLYYASARREETRGANHNASGVAALLALARDLAEHPIEGADVWLVATGSHEAWMAGMRHLLRTAKPGRDGVHLVNLEGVGAGMLCYLEREGFLHGMPAGRHVLAAARALGRTHDVFPRRLRSVLTEAHIPLSRGYDAITVTGLDPDGQPCLWRQDEDRMSAVDEAKVEQAARFAGDLLRRLADDA